jgi:hypothetical protein
MEMSEEQKQNDIMALLHNITISAASVITSCI